MSVLILLLSVLILVLFGVAEPSSKVLCLVARSWVRRMDQLLALLWPTDIEGFFTVYTIPGYESYHLTLKQLRNLSAKDKAGLVQENLKKSLYFNLGLTRGGLDKAHRGGKADTIAIPGFVLDIDTQAPPGIHKADNKDLPKTDADVLRILEGVPNKLLPSIFINTGYGYHVHWLLAEPLFLRSEVDRSEACRAFEAFQAPIIAHAKTLGFQVDLTATIDRLWRIPGFNNVKDPTNPVPVKIIETSDARYRPEDLGIVAHATSNGGEPAAAVSTPPPSTASADRGSVSIPALKKRLANLVDEEDRKVLEKVLAGKSFAEAGTRDITLQEVCSIIVWTAQGKGTPEILAEILRPSLIIWAAEPDATKTIDQEMTKAVDKTHRAQRDWDNKEAETYARRQADLEALGRWAFGDDYQPGTLTQKHLLIQKDRWYFIYNFTEKRYVGSHTKDELLPVVRDAFGESSFPISYVNDKGVEVDFLPPKLMKDYGTVCREIQGSLTLQRSYFDYETHIFARATTPVRRQLTSRFNQSINDWLEILVGGDPDHFKAILDFMAGTFHLDHQCAALALIGEPGTGKTTLAHGLARIWHTGGPTKWQFSVGQSFNEALIKCPLIELSEGVDDTKGVSSAFRDLIGTQELFINPKGKPPFHVDGCCRIIIGSNDDGALRDIVGKRGLSTEAAGAIANRLYILPVSVKAAEHLTKIKKKHSGAIHNWVYKDKIAKHAMWLYENRKLDLDSRFLITNKQSITPAHRRLVRAGAGSNAVLEWITEFMSDPRPFLQIFKTKRKIPHSAIGAGKLLLNGTEIRAAWTTYITDHEPLSATALGLILKNLGARKSINSGGSRIHAYEIATEQVFLFAEDTMLGDLDKMKDHLSNGVNWL